MLGAVRARLTYANVVASLALFLALGGIGWAATTLPKNSVGSAQIKPNSVSDTDLKELAIPSVVSYGSNPVQVADGDGEKTVIKRSVKTRRLSNQLIYGQVAVKNDGEAPVVVKLRGDENGEPEPHVATQSVAPGDTETVPLSLLCKGMRPGVNTYIIQVSVGKGSVTVTDRSLIATAFPS
ncbi:MAG TPA: hypothetical protein VJT75_11045 [Thermoleophilaceae bacterium]|nr:hypothetical protein [Thermoleophilaceae bacterium]